MKYFWIIFSFYLLIQAIIPCCIHQECNQLNNSEISIRNNIHTDDSHHQSTHESCTPFCQCSFCHNNFAFTNIDFSITLVIQLIKSHKNFYFTYIDKSEFYYNIWQPPKINC